MDITPERLENLKESIKAGLDLENAKSRFSEHLHNENMKRVNIRVTKEVHEFFKAKSDKTGVTMSTLMYLALESYMHQEIVASNLPAMLDMAKNLMRNEQGELAVS